MGGKVEEEKTVGIRIQKGWERGMGALLGRLSPVKGQRTHSVNVSEGSSKAR